MIIAIRQGEVLSEMTLVARKKKKGKEGATSQHLDAVTKWKVLTDKTRNAAFVHIFVSTGRICCDEETGSFRLYLISAHFQLCLYMHTVRTTQMCERWVTEHCGPLQLSRIAKTYELEACAVALSGWSLLTDDSSLKAHAKNIFFFFLGTETKKVVVC